MNLTEDQMKEIATNIANAITNSDIETYPSPKVFNKALYVGAMQALKHAANSRISLLEQELQKANKRVEKLEEMLKY